MNVLRKRPREEEDGENEIEREREIEREGLNNTRVLNTQVINKDNNNQSISSQRPLAVVKRQRVISYSEILSAGDVVFVWRPLGYKHYGIVSEVGHNYVMVIHYWAYGSKLNACIRQDPLELFIDGGRIENYNNNNNNINNEENNRKSNKLHVLDFSNRLVRMLYGSPLDSQQVVANALRKLGKKEGKYNLLQNNCEHFAIKCKTGKSVCWQSLKYKLAGGILFFSSLMYPYLI